MKPLNQVSLPLSSGENTHGENTHTHTLTVIYETKTIIASHDFIEAMIDKRNGNMKCEHFCMIVIILATTRSIILHSSDYNIYIIYFIYMANFVALPKSH